MLCIGTHSCDLTTQVASRPNTGPCKGLDLLEQAAQLLKVRRLAAVLVLARLRVAGESSGTAAKAQRSLDDKQLL